MLYPASVSRISNLLHTNAQCTNHVYNNLWHNVHVFGAIYMYCISANTGVVLVGTIDLIPSADADTKWVRTIFKRAYQNVFFFTQEIAFQYRINMSRHTYTITHTCTCTCICQNVHVFAKMYMSQCTCRNVHVVMYMSWCTCIIVFVMCYVKSQLAYHMILIVKIYLTCFCC